MKLYRMDSVGIEGVQNLCNKYNNLLNRFALMIQHVETMGL